MKKLINFILLIILLLSLLTTFGPWKNYRTPGPPDILGQTVYVEIMPIWIGETLRYFGKVHTEEDAVKEHNDWIDRQQNMAREYLITEPERSEYLNFYISMLEKQRK
jgi:hypothetical protein